MYDYNQLKNDIELLSSSYDLTDIFSIGDSVKGRKLYTVKFGTGKKEVYYNGAHHGLEHITSKLLMKFIFDLCYSYNKNIKLRGCNLKDLYEKSSIYITPMVNPDGVEMSKRLKDWQANARGVDLNHNYDAMWKRGKIEIARQGISKPGPTKYSGPYPFSEPETKAVANFTVKHNFDYVVAFHSQGEVIYWKYGPTIPDESVILANAMSKVSGYALDETSGTASYSGYKDWFIKTYNKPGFTVEVGKGTNPISENQLPKIYNDILELLLLVGV
ncbi:MAG: M14 family metallocarboxypeptidase [Clostridia bacterium]|nr:M14 family metallocarboxypeptidase [Clostridia bacterium]